MATRRTGFTLTILAAAALIFSFARFASAQDEDNNYQDPPSRAGRLSYVTGSVSFQPGGQGDWLDAVVNRPLTTGDNLWADRDSRAEVQIGSTSIRLAPETSVTFLDLGNNVTQLRLSVGSLYFRIRRLDEDDSFEVDTPNLAFTVSRPGEYRVDVDENGDQTIATVWHGEGEITGGGSTYRLMEGQQGTFSGTDQLTYNVGGIGQPDDFDQWAFDRDRREDRVHSAQYVSNDMTGYEDLDEYGRWHNVDGYGNVWTPVGVEGDWAPYRFGHWVFIAPWGWTWVEDEPWGFAPFHYGRWVYAGGWCWVPGPVVVRPVYSPALVAFVGGGGFHVGVGVGVGWFPLGPGEVFVPWYRTSPRYVQNVNVTNTHVTVVQVTNVYNNVTVNHVNNITYVNQRGGHGITVVDHNTFVNAQPVNQHIVAVNQRELAAAPVTHEVVRNIQPVQQSVIGSARPVRYAPPAPVMSRPVVATRAPVITNHPSIPAVARRAPLPPVRTVEAAPQAETLNRGARGRTPGIENGPNAGRPSAPQNQPGGPADAQRPGMNAPRPGSSEMTRQPSQNNYPVERPAPPVNNRPNPPENNQRNFPQANQPSREVPRPPSARPEQPQVQPERPMNAPEASPRPENRPSEPAPQQNRTNTPENRPSAPESRPYTPPQPESRPAPPKTRPYSQPQPESRPEPPQTRPYNPPQPQPESRPAQPESRPYSSPQSQNRPALPETRQDVPRPPAPEARPANPPPQHESRPAESHEKNNNNNDSGREKKFR